MANTTYQTLDLLRAYSGVPASGEDVYLQALLNAAAEAVDSYCNTRFVSTSVTAEQHDGDGGRWLKLRHRPVLSVTSVTIDGATIDSSTYEVNLEEGYLIIPEIDETNRDPRVWRSGSTPGWPRGARNIAVTYSYGYSGDIPPDVVAATSMIAAALYQENQRRGIQSEQAGPYSATYLQQAGLPSGARMLLDRYRQPELGG